MPPFIYYDAAADTIAAADVSVADCLPLDLLLILRHYHAMAAMIISPPCLILLPMPATACLLPFRHAA